MQNFKSRLHGFLRAENGSQSIEFVIWMPIFVFVIAFTLNVSMVFYQESQLMRVVQDANRNFSIGRFTMPQQVKDYVASKVSGLTASPVITSDLSGGIITTQLSVPATDLMPFTLLDRYFDQTQITVSSSHFVEY